MKGSRVTVRVRVSTVKVSMGRLMVSARVRLMVRVRFMARVGEESGLEQTFERRSGKN